MRSVSPRQLRSPAHQPSRRTHTPRCRWPHQNEHRPQKHKVESHSGRRGKKGGNNKRCKMQHCDHGVPPSPTMSCDIGNGTPSATLNLLKTMDLAFRLKWAFVWRETRRGQADADLMVAFGRTANQSYCSGVRKGTLGKHFRNTRLRTRIRLAFF